MKFTTSPKKQSAIEKQNTFQLITFYFSNLNVINYTVLEFIMNLLQNICPSPLSTFSIL